MMKNRTPFQLAAIGALLATSALMPMASGHAVEVTAGNAETNSTYNALMTSSKMRAEFMRQQIAAERQARIDGDIAVRATIQQRMDEVNQRVTELNNRVTSISNEVSFTQTTFLAEVNALKTDVETLRTDMNARVANLNAQITAMRNHMNGSVASLQSQINSINASINDLNTRMNDIRNRLANLESFTNYLSNRLEQLRACFANGSCVGYRQPQVQTTEFSVWGGDAGFGQYTAHVNTGLHTSQWQYCSLAGGTNVSRRDFRIYESGGYWWVANEYDNYWLGDETGNITAICMRVY